MFLYLWKHIPKWIHQFSSLGGNQIIDSPLLLNQSYSFQNSLDVNHYQYSFSFWFYSNTNASQINKYVNILTNGGKPCLSYHLLKKTWKVTFIQNSIEKTIYIQNQFPLQKWNHFVFNYDRGNFDIFFNTNLVHSSMEIVPYMKFEQVVVGEENVNSGWISNVLSFKKCLSLSTLHYIYHFCYPPNLF
jgi:hypothetical protein